MVVAMACTENWYHYLAVDIYSLLKTTPAVKKIYLLLETDNINDIPELKKVIEKYPVEIKLINFNNMIDDLIEKDNVNRDTEFTNFCFARLALPSIVEEEKVLYLDTDAIVLKDISELWNINIDNYYLAGCKDLGAFERDNISSRLGITGKYINSGVLLMNLKKIREDNIYKKWFETINKRQLIFPDQDAINLVCQKGIIYIPAENNFALGVTSKFIEKKYIKIIHYVNLKIDWVRGKPYSELWYNVEENFYKELDIRR